MEWFIKCLAEAKTAAPVAEAVVARLETEVAGTMRERALRPAELAEVARGLISASHPAKGGNAP